MNMDIDALLRAFDDPTGTGARAAAIRDRAFGRRVVVRAAPLHRATAVAALVRDGAVFERDAWPPADELRGGDGVVLAIEPDGESRARFAAWLRDAARRDDVDWSVAPFSRESAGLHRLWCIAAARLALPPRVRVEARHDLIGIRLAQVALGFGADTLSGPILPDRSLPLAGVPRPDEATTAGLAALAREAGLEPSLPTPPPP